MHDRIPVDAQKDIYDTGMEWAHKANLAWGRLQIAQRSLRRYEDPDFMKGAPSRARMADNARSYYDQAQLDLHAAEVVIGKLIGANIAVDPVSGVETIAEFGIVTQSPYRTE